MSVKWSAAKRRGVRGLKDERLFIDVVRGKQSVKQLLYQEVSALLNQTHDLFLTCHVQCAKIILICNIAAKFQAYIVREQLQFHECMYNKLMEFKTHLIAQIGTKGPSCLCTCRPSNVPRIFPSRSHITEKYVSTMDTLITAYKIVPGVLAPVFKHLDGALNHDLAVLIMAYITTLPFPCRDNGPVESRGERVDTSRT